MSLKLKKNFSKDFLPYEIGFISKKKKSKSYKKFKMVKRNACIFISGKGSNLKNLINRSRDYNFPVSIKLVVSNKKGGFGSIACQKNFIPYLIVNTKSRNFENNLLKELKKYNISIICLAGYMKILSKKFLRNFGKRL